METVSGFCPACEIDVEYEPDEELDGKLFCPECGRSREMAEKAHIAEYQEEREAGLILGFWEMGIIGTLMIVFFPWSLLFCLFMYGMEHTKALLMALIHDATKVIFAILSVIVPIVLIIVVLFFASV